MSHLPPGLLETTHTWLVRIATIAQARDLLALVDRCAVALDAILAEHSFELVWESSEPPPFPPQLAPPSAPDPDELQMLRDGLLVHPSPGVGYVPLLVGGELRGWLRIESGPWSEEQAQALLLTAAVLAPTHAQLEQQQQQHAAAQRRALMDAMHHMREFLQLEPLLAYLHQIVEDLIGPAYFFVILREENSDWLELAYVGTNGQRLDRHQFSGPRAGLTGAILASRTPIITNDYMHECRQYGIAPLPIDDIPPPFAWMGAPLIAREQVVGAMNVFHTTPDHPFSPTDVEILLTLANEAAVTIQNARLYARVERQTRQLTTLNRISRTITSTLDPERVPSLIMQQVQELLDIEEGSLLLRDEQNGDLIFAYACGPTGNRLIGQRLPPDVGIAGYVLNSGQPALVNDTRSDGRFDPTTDIDTGFLTRSLIAVPLHGIDGVRGVIEVMNRRNGAPFVDEDCRLLEAVADQAVIALENARRFAQTDQALARRARELDRSNGQLRELLRMGNALRAERRLDELLRQIAQSVSTSTGFHSAVIALVQRERTAQPYLQRMVASGPVEAALERLSAARAPLVELEALLRPEFQRGLSSYLISHNHDEYFKLWGGIEQVYMPDLPDRHPGGWNPRDTLFSLMRDSRGELLGLLSVDEPEDGMKPTPEQIQILEIFANQAAIAIENARLYSEQQHSLLSMMALNALGMAIHSTVHSEAQIFELTTSGMVEMTDAQSALTLLAADTESEEAYPHDRSAATAALQLVFRRGPVTNNEAAAVDALARQAIRNGRLSNAQIKTGVPDTSNSWVAIPLRATQKVLGAICVGYTDGLPSPAELETLTLFASQAAVAVESMRFFSAVRQGRDRLASIMASTKEGIVLITGEGQIAVANNALHNLIGSGQWGSGANTSPAAPARPVFTQVDAFLQLWEAMSSYPEAEWQALRAALDRVASGAEDLIQGQLNPTAVNARTLEWTVLPVTGERSEEPFITRSSDNGQPAARRSPMLLILRDITADKEAERLRQDLTHMIIHDLRSPLTSVIASIDMIFKGVTGEVTKTQHDVLTIAFRSTQQLLDMVNILLDIGRLESGRMPLNRTPSALAPLVQRAIERLSLIAQNKRISFIADLPDDLPAVYADGELIVRVIQNLLDNALKFSQAGGNVRITAEQHGTQPGEAAGESDAVQTRNVVTVKVQDFGVGIPARDLDKIFIKFGQAGERRNSGTGLGLTFCKLVVEAHEGSIWVESTLGEGSTFAFTLGTLDDKR